MKRMICLLTVFTFMFSFGSLLPQGPYVKALGGYALGVQNHFIGSEISENSQGEITSVKDVYHSFGKGAKLDVAIGFPLNPNVAVQFESGYAIMGGVTLEDTDNFSGATITSKEEVSASYIPVQATVIVSAGEKGEPRPYVGAGAGVYLYSLSTKFTNSLNSALSKVDHKVKLPIGLHGMVGAEFPMGEKMVFFGELRMVSLALTQLEDELVELRDTDGNDVLDQVSAENRVQKYEKDSTEDPAPGTFSANSLGLFVGFKIAVN